MGRKKKKVFDPLDAVITHGKLGVGTIGVVGVAGSLHSQMPSNVGGGVMRSMDTLKIIPTVHASSVAMGSLGMFTDIERKIKKRR